MDLYEVLGVTRDATIEELRRAYRAACAKHHPDRKGGNKAKFQEAEAAFRVLSDQETRAHYDETGDWPGQAGDTPLDHVKVAKQQLSAIFLEVAAAGITNFRREIEKRISQGESQTNTLIDKARAGIKTFDRAAKALPRRKCDGFEDFLAKAAESRIEGLQVEIAQAEEILKTIAEMRRLMAEGYDYNEVPGSVTMDYHKVFGDSTFTRML